MTFAYRGRKRKVDTQSLTTEEDGKWFGAAYTVVFFSNEVTALKANVPSQASVKSSDSSSETDDGEIDLPRTKRRVIVNQV